MKFSIEVRESATESIAAAFLYYERKQVGLGHRFLICWEKHLEIVGKEPELFQKKYKNFRQALIKPFPYHIVFEIEKMSVIVYKVVYAGRHPGKRYAKT
jgi:hypothetical protein